MYIYLGKRFVQIIITLLLFQAVTYFLMDAQPGDIADLLTMDPNIPPNERQRLRAELGLDRPPAERFLKYIVNFYKGDLGVSFSHYPRPVIDIIKERLPRTVVLFLSASIVSFWVGFITGKIVAWRRGEWIEYGATVSGVVLWTIFLPFFALMMIWLFAVLLDWFPAGKFLDPLNWLDAPVDANTIFQRLIWTYSMAGFLAFVGLWLSNRTEQGLRLIVRGASMAIPLGGMILYWGGSGFGSYAWDIVSHLMLPILTLILYTYGGTMLLMRTSMLETMREDYIMTARAKGLPDKTVRDKHAARTALLPVWTGLVFRIPSSISGGIITETMFSWPGIGLTLFDAALSEDIPLAMGVLTIVGVLTLISHLVADVGYAFLDPRIRYG